MRKITILSILSVLLLGAYQQNTYAQPNPSEIEAKMKASCQTLPVSRLLEEKEWDQIYESFPTENGLPLSSQELIDYIHEKFTLIIDIVDFNEKEGTFDFGDGMGISLDENELDIESEEALISQQDNYYLIRLQQDNLQFLLADHFDASSIMKFKQGEDTNFQDLCVDSDPLVIAAIKLVLFRSAADLYISDQK